MGGTLSFGFFVFVFTDLISAVNHDVSIINSLIADIKTFVLIIFYSFRDFLTVFRLTCPLRRTGILAPDWPPALSLSAEAGARTFLLMEKKRKFPRWRRSPACPRDNNRAAS